MRYEEVTPPQIAEGGFEGLHVWWIDNRTEMIYGQRGATVVKCDPAYGDEWDLLVRDADGVVHVVLLSARAKVALADGEKLEVLVWEARSRAMAQTRGWSNE